MSISSGDYTIGISGDYATVQAFLEDIAVSGLTGNLKGTVITDCEATTSALTIFIQLNGFTLEITSTPYHYGYLNPATPKISINYFLHINIVDTINIPNNYLIIRNNIFNCINTTSDEGFFRVNSRSIDYYAGAVVFFGYNIIYGTNRLNTTACGVNLDSAGYWNISEVIAYRNLFYNFTSSLYGALQIHQTPFGGYVENNTFFNCNIAIYFSVADVGSSSTNYSNNNLFIENTTDFYNIPASIDIIEFYNCATDKANFSPATTETNCIYNLVLDSTNGDSYIVSYIPPRSTFLKLSDSVLKDAGMPPMDGTENTEGIRLNVLSLTPSIGADEYAELDPNLPVNSVNLGGYELPYPQYPYKTVIDFSWDIVTTSSDKVTFFDNGSSIDRRSCQATFLLTTTEATNFTSFWQAYKTNYSSSPLELFLESDSGWFPFGQDRGNRGKFLVEVNLLSKVERSKTFFNLFEVNLEFINVGAYPSYTFVTDVDEGSFAIADTASLYTPVTGIRTPEYKVNGDYAIDTVQNEAFTDYNTTIELNGDTQFTDFSLVTNLSKMQRVLKLLTDNRTEAYTISDGGGNIFGYSFNFLQNNLRLMKSTYTVTANKFNEYQIDLRFTDNG